MSSDAGEGGAAGVMVEWARLEPVPDRCVNALPEKYRLPLLLHHFEGHSQRGGSGAGLQAGHANRATYERAALKASLERCDVLMPAETFAALLGARAASAAMPDALVVTISVMALIAAETLRPMGTSRPGRRTGEGHDKRNVHDENAIVCGRGADGAAAIRLGQRCNAGRGATCPVTSKEGPKPLPVVAVKAPEGLKPATTAQTQPPAAALPAAADPFTVLVQNLADGDETIRENAESSLRDAGKKAEAALQTGVTDDDPRVKSRCEALLGF